MRKALWNLLAVLALSTVVVVPLLYREGACGGQEVSRSDVAAATGRRIQSARLREEAARRIRADLGDMAEIETRGSGHDGLVIRSLLCDLGDGSLVPALDSALSRAGVYELGFRRIECVGEAGSFRLDPK